MNLDIICVCVCVCVLSVKVCTCVFGAWVHEWERAGEKAREVFAFVCMRFAGIFGCTSFSKTLLGSTHTDQSSCFFTSSWCSFCSRSWSTPGCCLQTALMQRIPEAQAQRTGMLVNAATIGDLTVPWFRGLHLLPCHFSHKGTSASELFCAWRHHPGVQSPQSGSQWPFLPSPWSDSSRYEL